MDKEQDDVEVTREDQQRINSFGRITARQHEIANDLKELNEECENLEDAEGEVGLLDDDEIMYKIGGVFVRLQREEAEERITKELEELREKKEALEAESDKNKTDLAELKVVLYEKFGSNINLEE